AQISTEQVDSTEAPGTVIGSTPGAGSPAGRETRIVLQVSGGPADIPVGPADIPVPTSIIGQTETQARQTLQDAGFTGTITSERIPAEPGETPETVSFSDPPPGTEVPASQAIILYIAAPPEAD
ncbi:MAG TPA: PASTA domain-containing protein, partial [Blastococcus sp.]|nr:PASTA domain-containing protein [Blastococcus sp.]